MKNIHILRYDASPLLVVLTLGTLLLAGCNDKSVPVSMAPPEVSAAQVVVNPVTQWDEYSGRIEAIQSVELRPRVSGYLESVNYREGQEVKQGDVLFTTRCWSPNTPFLPSCGSSATLPIKRPRPI